MRTALQTDVLIVGGGPAGAATALALLQFSDLRVMLVEGSDLTAVRVGEQVDPSLFDLLAYLNIEKVHFEPGSFIRGYNVLSAWGTSQLSARSSIFSSREECYQLDREQFDCLLLSKAFERGAVVVPRARCVGVKQTEKLDWNIRLKHQTEGKLSVQARFLVDATGRNSSLSRQLGIQPIPTDQLMAVGVFLEAPKPDQLPHESLLETVEEGWWYAATLPNGQLVATLFTDADLVKEKHLQKADNWNALLAKTQHIRQRTAGMVAHESPWVKMAHSKQISATEQARFVAVGDAVASFDPVSSLGIGFALSSGCHAARALIGTYQGDQNALTAYQQGIDSIFRDYLQVKNKYYRQENRWPQSPFWERRQ